MRVTLKSITDVAEVIKRDVHGIDKENMLIYTACINDFLIDNVENYFDNEELLRIYSYFKRNDIKRSLIGRSIIKKFLGELYNLHPHDIQFYLNSNGKLYYNTDIFFNVSHSHDYVIVGFYIYEIGIDIEKIEYQFNWDSMYEYILSDFEIGEFKLLGYSEVVKKGYMYWVYKESMGKAFGLGLDSKLLKNTFVEKIRVGTNDVYSISGKFIGNVYIYELNYNYIFAIMIKGKRYDRFYIKKTFKRK